MSSVTRRALIAGSLAATVVPGAQLSFGQPADSPPIDIGLITEPTASHRSGYLSVLAHCQGVRSVSVADPTGETLEEARKQLGDRFLKGFADIKKMLGTVRPALTVVTMEGRRAPTAVQAALRAGSHVLTEKPSCVRLSQFVELAQLADRQDVHLMLAMATRSSAAIQKARQLIRDGQIGKPYACSMDWVADQTRLTRPSYHRSWLSFKDQAGGGKLLYHGVHYLDVIQYLIDDSIQQINGFTQNVGGQPIEVEDAAVVSFRCRQGMIGNLNTGYYLDQGKQTQIRIWGSAGWLRLEHLERKPLQWHSTKPDAPVGVQTFAYDQEPGLYQLFFQAAIDAVRMEAEPPISTRQSLRALKVVFGAYEAVKTGQTQEIN